MGNEKSASRPLGSPGGSLTIKAFLGKRDLPSGASHGCSPLARLPGFNPLAVDRSFCENPVELSLAEALLEYSCPAAHWRSALNCRYPPAGPHYRFALAPDRCVCCGWNNRRHRGHSGCAAFLRTIIAFRAVGTAGGLLPGPSLLCDSK